jgi:protein phosphatase
MHIPFFSKIPKKFTRPQSAQTDANAKAEPLFEDESGAYIKISFATDTGKVRENNEDSFYIDGKYRHVYGYCECDSYIELSDETHIYSVFDGMGGEAYGETASALAAVHMDRLAPMIKSAEESEISDCMTEYLRVADSAICDMSKKRSGSTFACVCVKNGLVYAFYLGDSRIYLCENGEMRQVSRDHTLAEKKRRDGIYTAAQAEKSTDRHKLTAYLGCGRNGIYPQLGESGAIKAEAGTKFVICSDGLYDMCTDDEIFGIMQSGAENPARALADKATENGGGDNVTCITIEFDEFAANAENNDSERK